MKDVTPHKIFPEYANLEAFVEFCLEGNRETYNHVDLQELAFSLRLSHHKVRLELEGYGLSLVYREKEKDVRGVHSSCDHDRFWGPGAEKMHGGSGHEQINGWAGREG